MSTITAKVFESGNSKALRLPVSLKVRAKAFTVTPTGTGFLLTDPAEEARRSKALRKLMSLKPLDHDLPRP